MKCQIFFSRNNKKNISKCRQSASVFTQHAVLNEQTLKREHSKLKLFAALFTGETTPVVKNLRLWYVNSFSMGATLVLLNPYMRCLCKQCRSRSFGF